MSYNIAYTVDYTGDNDDILTFCFRGALPQDVHDVFEWLGGGGNAFGGFRVWENDDVLRRNGRCTNYLMVQIDSFNELFCSVSEFCLLIEARFHAQAKCKITKLTLNKFFNI